MRGIIIRVLEKMLNIVQSASEHLQLATVFNQEVYGSAQVLQKFRVKSTLSLKYAGLVAYQPEKFFLCDTQRAMVLLARLTASVW